MSDITITRVFAIALAVIGPVLCAPPAARADLVSDGVAPQGKRLVLGLYAIGGGDMKNVAKSGWNVAHSYQYSLTWLAEVAGGGQLALGRLPGESGPVSEQGKQLLRDSARSPNIAWWDLPEERRASVSGELQLIREYVELTRSLDPQKRPTFMYIPGHYSQKDIEPWVPVLDVIPAAVYTHHQGQPHAWARWRVESNIRAIKATGARIGRDFLNGEKWPAAVHELFEDDQEAAGCVHDFWQSLASGSRAILFYAYFYRNKSPSLTECWQALDQAASQLTGTQGLEEMVLDPAEMSELDVTITAGPPRTQEFRPALRDQSPVSFVSVHAVSKTVGGETFVIAVNSVEEAVTAQIDGLPPSATLATVLFENRSVALQGGRLTETFPSLGVHVYRLGTRAGADAGADGPPAEASDAGPEEAGTGGSSGTGETGGSGGGTGGVGGQGGGPGGAGGAGGLGGGPGGASGADGAGSQDGGPSPDGDGPGAGGAGAGGCTCTIAAAVRGVPWGGLAVVALLGGVASRRRRRARS